MSQIISSGSEVTLITWGAMTPLAKQSVLQLQQDVSIEHVHLLSLKPIDYNPIFRSVKKTGRCLIVHEAVRAGGIGATLSADISEALLPYLKAPIARLTAPDLTPPAPLHEAFYIPTSYDIVQAIIRLLG